jgi:hypothetical protein
VRSRVFPMNCVARSSSLPTRKSSPGWSNSTGAVWPTGCPAWN